MNLFLIVLINTNNDQEASLDDEEHTDVDVG
jgi:hypothetical protein